MAAFRASRFVWSAICHDAGPGIHGLLDAGHAGCRLAHRRGSFVGGAPGRRPGRVDLVRCRRRLADGAGHLAYRIGLGTDALGRFGSPRPHLLDDLAELHHGHARIGRGVGLIGRARRDMADRLCDLGGAGLRLGRGLVDPAGGLGDAVRRLRQFGDHLAKPGDHVTESLSEAVLVRTRLDFPSQVAGGDPLRQGGELFHVHPDSGEGIDQTAELAGCHEGCLAFVLAQVADRHPGSGVDDDLDQLGHRPRDKDGEDARSHEHDQRQQPQVPPNELERRHQRDRSYRRGDQSGADRPVMGPARPEVPCLGELEVTAPETQKRSLRRRNGNGPGQLDHRSGTPGETGRALLDHGDPVSRRCGRAQRLRRASVATRPNGAGGWTAAVDRAARIKGNSISGGWRRSPRSGEVAGHLEFDASMVVHGRCASFHRLPASDSSVRIPDERGRLRSWYRPER
jgi:hypothetical protein